jgi:hypothetical protein
MQMHRARDKMGDRRWSRERGRGEGEMSFPCLIDLNRIPGILAGSPGLQIVLVAKIMQAFCLPHSTIRPLHTRHKAMYAVSAQIGSPTRYRSKVFFPKSQSHDYPIQPNFFASGALFRDRSRHSVPQRCFYIQAAQATFVCGI